jgi:predicted RNA-binding Zn ribbon-like protein
MTTEPVALAFANTRPSHRRDYIATVALWRAWVDAWPGICTAGHAVDADGLLALRTIRDDVQLLLRGAATGEVPTGQGPTSRLLELASSALSIDLGSREGGLTLAVSPKATPAAIIAQHLTRAALDLLLTGPPLTACQGQDCLKLFATFRSDRRWCDSATCGNRVRVRNHRRHARRSTRPGRTTH